jgi:hypothetical protein
MNFPAVLLKLTVYFVNLFVGHHCWTQRTDIEYRFAFRTPPCVRLDGASLGQAAAY